MTVLHNIYNHFKSHGYTGLSPFQFFFRYQPPLFPEIEPKVNFPATATMDCRCWRMWARTKSTLVKSSAAFNKTADRNKQAAPNYHHGQRVWLSIQDLSNREDSHKLTQRFIDPFPASRVINPFIARFKLPMSS